MKRLLLALAASSAVAFGAVAQSNPGTSSKNEGAPAVSQSGASGSRSVKVRANIDSGTRTTVRSRTDSPSVAYRTSRTRHVIASDSRPSQVTVVKKKKYAKNKKKKRTYVYASQPSRTTIVERRRTGGVVTTGVDRTREVSERRSGASVGVTTRTNSTTRTTTRSTTGSASGSGESGGASVRGTVNTR
jgi:hypothetical protein